MNDIVPDAMINNRYRILKKLGEGNMGNVYLTEDLLYDKRLVALKTIRPEKVSPDIIDVFKREFEIMTRLRHPNLAQVYEFGFDQTGSCFFLTMEYIEGQNLAEWRDEHPYTSDEEILELFVNLLRVMEFIHSRGVLHRDIKPKNVMVGQSVKLMDFGLADLDKNDDVKVKGTLRFFAPEILNGQVDERVDIFALGVTFYMVLTNQVFYKETLSSIYIILQGNDNFQRAQFLTLKNIKNENLRSILKKMTAFEPSKRYQTSTEVIADINKKFTKSFELETDKTRYAYVLGAGFVGREQELKKLTDRLFSEDGQKEILCVHGEAGIGKSRLFEEFKYQCQLQNISFLQGNCTESGGRNFEAFLPVVSECLLSAPDSLIDKYGPELKKLVPDHTRLKSTESNRKQDPIVERGLLIQTISNFLLESSSGMNEAAIYLNDMQWADEATMEVLEELMFKLQEFKPSACSSSLRIYVSSREEGLGKLDIINAKNRLIKQKLRPFDEVNVYSYMSAMFGEGKLDESLQKAIPEINKKVGGNPFFLQELIKSLVELELIVRQEHSWTLIESIENVEIPSSLKDLIVSRINRLNLNESERRILQILALLRFDPTGEEFRQFVDVEYDFLQRLEHLEIVKSEHFEGRVVYHTAHDLIREVVVSESLDRDGFSLKELHHHIADRMEAIHSKDLEPYVPELAYHYSEADNPEKALLYLERAADYARAEFKNREAILLYDRLTGYLVDSTEKIPVLLNKGNLLELIGNWGEAESEYRHALLLAESIQDKSLMVQSKCKLGMLFMLKAEYATAFDLFTTALDLLTEVEDQTSYCSVLSNLGTVYRQQNNFSKAMECYQQVLNISIELDDKQTRGQTIGDMGNIHLDQGQNAQAMECYQQHLRIAEEMGDKRIISTAVGNLGNVYFSQGDYALAMECFGRKLSLSEESGNKQSIGKAAGDMGLVYHMQGNFHLAMEYYQRKLSIAEELGDKEGISHAVGNMGAFCSDQGKITEALEYYQRLLKMAEEMNDKRCIGVALGNMGKAHSDQGDHNRAIACYQRAIGVHREISFKYGLTYWLYNLAETFFGKKTFLEAKKLIDECLDLSIELSKPDTILRGQFLQAKIDFALGGRKEVIKNLLEMLTQSGEKSSMANIYYALATLNKHMGNLDEKLALDDEEYSLLIMETCRFEIGDCREKALEIYRQLYEETPIINYKNRIEELDPEARQFQLQETESDTLERNQGEDQPGSAKLNDDEMGDALDSFI